MTSRSAARRFLVIGDPALSRVALFRRAAMAAACEVEVASYAEVLADPDAWQSRFAGRTIRLESPGRDFAIECALLTRGAARRLVEESYLSRWTDSALPNLRQDPGLIFASRQWYHGWRDALAAIERVADSAEAEFLNAPSEIAEMFDKTICHRRLTSRGIPVPPALPPPRSFDELISSMRAAEMGRVFLKPAHGSGAAGTVAFEIGHSGMRATTAVVVGGQHDRPALYATSRVRATTDGAEIRQIIDLLCCEHLHVEKWVPKAGLDGRTMDVRVVVIGGIAGPAILRLANAPITNLHLGASKAGLEHLAERAGERVLSRIAEVAESAMRCYPRCLYGGVDLLISADFRRPVVAEVNAFGDLLEDTLWHGADTYAWELRTWLDRSQTPPRCSVPETQLQPRLIDQVSATGR